MFPLLELFAGACVALVLLRAGMSSLYPLLLWVPLLSFSPSWLFVVGLVSASLAWEARGVIVSSFLFPWEWVIGFVMAILGLLAFSFFHQYFLFLDSLIVPLLLFSLIWFVLSSTRPTVLFVGAIFLVLVAGWLGLHVWMVPFALPAMLLGFFGWIPPSSSIPAIDSLSHVVRNGLLGVFSGILPGIGPGLMGALWFSGQSSPSLRVSNLVFSLGLVSLTGAVRSYPAGVLSSFTLPSWEWIAAYFLVGFFLSFGLSFLFSFSISFPSFVFFILHSFLLFILGGFPTVFLIGLTFSISRLLVHFHLPLSLGSLCLIPSILWFYY